MSGKAKAKKGSTTGQDVVSMFPKRPERPATTKAPGNTVRLISNLFRISYTQNKPIYRYTLNIERLEERDGDDPSGGKEAPPKKRKIPDKFCRQIVDEVIKTWVSKAKPADYPKNLNYPYVYDGNGSTIYTLFDMFAKSQSQQKQEFRVEIKLDSIIAGKLEHVPTKFQVFLHPGAKLDLDILNKYCSKSKLVASNITDIAEQIKAVNVILRGQISCIPINLSINNNVFPFKKENQFSISEGIIMNKGYFLSARPTESGLVANIANTLCAFYEEVDLIVLLKSRFRVQDLNQPLNPKIIADLKKELYNKQFEARHINYGTKVKPHYRKYRITDISGSSLDKFMLVDKATKSSKETTIAEYFKKEYNFVIKHPKLPCVIDKGRKIPLELCHLIDKQRVSRKMTPDETSNTIRLSAVQPQVHFETIYKNVKEVVNNSEPLENFGLKLDSTPIEVDGRELPPIKLIAGRNKIIQPTCGEYRPDAFFRPAVLNKWALAFIVDSFVKEGFLGEWAQKFSSLYVQEGRFKGVNVPDLKREEFIKIPADANIKRNLFQIFQRLNKTKVDHVIMVLPKTTPDFVYRYLQYLEASAQMDRRPGEKWTRVSCVKYENFDRKIINDSRGGKMFLSNLWLKYNTKLGGINFVLNNERHSFLQDGYLFLSIDVCHPAPGDKLIQSVAAVVGMWDLTNANMSYCTRMRVQKKMRENHSTIEEVGELGNMLEEVLDSYRDRKKRLPSNIVILRDGVSEGQFKIVLEGELRQVISTIQRKYVGSTAPKMSCMVVQKRHKTRFMRKQPVQTRKGPDYNIQPGTVVDSTVTHPTDFDFYLAPHKALQGTSRAAHIYMIYDEIKFSQDEAQAMVHALSYLSPRCTKSTSIPTPVNLADLAAERGKNLVISWNDDNPKMNDVERLQKLNKFLRDNLADANYKNTLFYV